MASQQAVTPAEAGIQAESGSRITSGITVLAHFVACLMENEAGGLVILSKPWRATPLYRQERFYSWERFSASIIADRRPLPQKKTQLPLKEEV